MITAIGATAAMTHIAVNQDHSTGLPIIISHVIEAPALTAAIMTCPTANTPLTGMPPMTTGDLAIDPENTIRDWQKDLHHLHALQHGSLRTGNINKSQSMTHHQTTTVQMTTTVTLMMMI